MEGSADHDQDAWSLHGIFAQVARRSPASVAVLAADPANDRPSISYSALNRESNQLAHHLRSLGVGRDVLVAVHLERSIEMIVAVLGVLKAGAAFLPLASEQPDARLSYMLRDANAPVLLTTVAMARRLGNHDARVVCIDQEHAIIAQQPTSALDDTTHPHDLAYCIYTSGSTGRPKGVLITHGGIPALMRAQSAWFGVSASDRILQFASFGFDAFVADLTMAFASGATLVLRSAVVGERLVKDMCLHGITIATLPPSLLAAIDLTAVRTLRCVISAGEACHRRHTQSVAAACAFFNAYGPTEATVWATGYRFTGDDGSDLPIGVAVEGVDAYVLDETLSTVQPGATGELYLSGNGLARGYLHRPDLTAERFIPNPFGSAGSRMYRTGDIVRRLADGQLDYLGRVDHQLKLRGYRIELGEIEQTLMRCAGVGEAVAVARNDTVGDSHLVAYLVALPGAAPTAEEIHGELEQQLPDYMLPSAYVFLAALPLNANGKIDRAELPAPAGGRMRAAMAYVAPRTRTEMFLAVLWCEVLKLDRVGIDDGFRSLGGSSIQAINIAFLISQAVPEIQRVPPLLGNASIRAYAIDLDGAHRAIATDGREIENPSEHTLSTSYAQDQVWFMEEMDEAWRAYRCHARLDLDGGLDVDCLRRALEQLVERHEILRTGFRQNNGRSERHVAARIEVTLPMIDLSDFDPAAQEQALDSCIADELKHRFDLSRPPLVRWLLVRLAEDSHALIQSEHHNVHDGQSFRILLHDLAALYSAAKNATVAALPCIEAQYGDFCSEEQRWLRSTDFANQLDQWTEKIAPLVRESRLFSRRAADQGRSFRGAQVRRKLSIDVFQRIGDSAAELGVSRYAFMLAVFGLLCASYSGQTRFLVGSGLANRNAARYRWALGMFVNMLPISIVVERADSFEALTQSVAGHVDFALSRSGVPLAEISRRLGLMQQLKGEAPFDVAFSFHDSLPAPTHFGDVALCAYEALGNGSAKFDMNVVAILGNEAASGSMELVFEYDSDVFDHSKVERMAAHFLQLASAVAANPHTPIRDVALLSEAERHLQLSTWNATDSAFPENDSIHGVFEQHVASSPDAIAVVFDDGHLTYAQLNVRANQLAHHLRALGLMPDALVAICLRRSPEMLIGLLAVLKAGAAYLPLDPEQPASRLAQMLRESRPVLLLTQQRFVEVMAVHGLAIVSIDQDWTATVTRHPSTNPVHVTQAQHLAYCLFTSGSTGTPKAIAITHRNVLRLVKGISYAKLDQDEVLLQAAPLSFDASTFEIWGGLLNGACVALARGDKYSLEDLADDIARHHVTTLWLTAALLEPLTSAHLPALRGVRQLLAGGDVLPVSAVRRLLDTLPGCRLINGYGPTESTTFAACYPFPDRFDAAFAPIGRPIANTQIYILDIDLRPLPIGVTGEIFIAGAGLARGYLNRPDLTAERFVPDPFGAPGGRMYRSGDLGRYDTQGNIEFLGRIDDQVKIRGYRIEPAEVTRLLRSCSGVRDAQVLAIDDPADGIVDEKRLVAYVVMDEDAAAPDEDGLRAELREHLPDYMLPTSYVYLRELPLNANGKVDRRLLPCPTETRRSALRQSLPVSSAQSQIARQIVAMMQSIRPGAEIAAHEDFFDAGFHSIDLMRLIAKCRSTFGIRLSMAETVDALTATDLADIVERRSCGLTVEG